MAGTWTRYMMIILASLLIILLLLIYPLGPIIMGVQSTGEIAFGSAYSLTQRIVSAINLVSASPQNETVIIKLNPLKCKIDFYPDYSYVESEVEYLGKSNYGLFIFKDIKLTAPPSIDCNTDKWKNIYIKKIGNEITISE